jgi:predicted dehydrogenase
VAKVRVGIVGFGFMARIHHGCLARIPDAEVVAVASPTPGHAERFLPPHSRLEGAVRLRELVVRLLDPQHRADPRQQRVVVD